jgi:hypothetical protein
MVSWLTIHIKKLFMQFWLNEENDTRVGNKTRQDNDILR